MVLLKVTGPNTFDWIATKYAAEGTMADCLVNFNPYCFIGTSATKDFYTVNLVAELWNDGK